MSRFMHLCKPVLWYKNVVLFIGPLDCLDLIGVVWIGLEWIGLDWIGSVSYTHLPMQTSDLV